MKGKLLIGVTGMPGAGKATVEKFVQNLGYPVVVMGDEIRDEAKRRGLKLTPENLGMVMLKLREEEGPNVIAERCIPKIEKANGNIVVVDGIRSPHEVKEFKRHFPRFTLIAIHASPETRFQRLFKRRRSDDPNEWDTFAERDLRELSVSLGDVIVMADYMIVNEGTKNQLTSQIRKILEAVMEKWTG
ncbi:MAG: AAA family ATPase [Candidatus Bathyarchaeota archaeon]|nr:AAA family ATPase [Candidatus Bathyarchaeota archaeon]MDH5778987.1 AAA family ATPase [Candidatus Bathyarchaeota archaeon]